MGVTWAHDGNWSESKLGPNSLRVRSTIRGKVTTSQARPAGRAGRERSPGFGGTGRVETARSLRDVALGSSAVPRRDGRDSLRARTSLLRPPQRRTCPLAGRSSIRMLFDARPANASTVWGNTSTAFWTKRVPSSTWCNGTEVSIPSCCPAEATASSGTSRVGGGAGQNHTRWVAERQTDRLLGDAAPFCHRGKPICSATACPNAAGVGVGVWQSKLRYRPRELLGVVREHKRRAYRSRLS